MKKIGIRFVSRTMAILGFLGYFPRLAVASSLFVNTGWSPVTGKLQPTGIMSYTYIPENSKILDDCTAEVASDTRKNGEKMNSRSRRSSRPATPRTTGKGSSRSSRDVSSGKK
jgi:hypothetical protein